MEIRSRSRIVLVASTLVGLTLTSGCSKEKAETRQLLAVIVEAHRQLVPKLKEAQAGLAKSKADIEALADGVPGGKELRERYFATEEVLGVLDGKIKWLSGQIEEARKSLDKRQVLEIKDAIASTLKDLGEVAKSSVEILHAKVNLQRVAALLKTPERFSAFQRTLSTGYAIKGAEDGVEARLLAFIDDASQKIARTTWFDFDRLFFVRDSADLDIPASRLQLDNVAQILKAYPKVKLEIGGFTDDTGAAAADRKRSQARAQAVAQALTQMAVAPARLRAEGFGSRQAACPANDTDECKARNRRIAVRVSAK